MIDWKPYSLSDIPFLAIPAIRVDSPDKRANGKLFCEKVGGTAANEMKKLILTEEFPAVFLRSPSTVLGNGKSAILAHIYWELFDEGHNVAWATATTNPKLKDLLARVLDGLVLHGKISRLKESLKPLSIQSISKVLKDAGYRRADSALYAAYRILSADEEELTYKYANIRRTIPVQEHAELFGLLLDLIYATKQPRVVIFIDQFEEFVRSHRTSSERIQLAEQINDLQRAMGDSTTLVLSTHPEAESILTETSPEGETFTKIEQSGVSIPNFDEESCLELVRFYLAEFRLPRYNGSSLKPFDEKVVRYSATRVAMNPRDLMLSLRAALLQGAMNGYPQISAEFVSRFHERIYGGLENRLDDYLKSKFKFEMGRS